MLSIIRTRVNPGRSYFTEYDIHGAEMEIERNEEQRRGGLHGNPPPFPTPTPQHGAPSCCVLMTAYRVARIHRNNG